MQTAKTKARWLAPEDLQYCAASKCVWKQWTKKELQQSRDQPKLNIRTLHEDQDRFAGWIMYTSMDAHMQIIDMGHSEKADLGFFRTAAGLLDQVDRHLVHPKCPRREEIVFFVPESHLPMQQALRSHGYIATAVADDEIKFIKRRAWIENAKL